MSAIENETVKNKKIGRKAAVAATVGTIIEWYDFFLYATASALIFPKLFFQHLTRILEPCNRLVRLLSVFLLVRLVLPFLGITVIVLGAKRLLFLLCFLWGSVAW